MLSHHFELHCRKKDNKELVVPGFKHKTLDEIDKRLGPPAEAGDPPYGLDTGTCLLPPGMPWPCDQCITEVFLQAFTKKGRLTTLTMRNLSTEGDDLISDINLNFQPQHRLNP